MTASDLAEERAPGARLWDGLAIMSGCGERLARAEGWSRVAAGLLSLSALVLSSWLTSAGVAGRMIVMIKADPVAVLLAAFGLLLAARLAFLTGRFTAPGAVGPARKAADKVAAPAIAKRIIEAAKTRQEAKRRPVGEVAAFVLLLLGVIAAGSLLETFGWLHFSAQLDPSARQVLLGAAVAAALSLALFGRHAALSEESDFRKKVAGFLYGALDDRAGPGQADGLRETAPSLDDRRHRSSALAQLSIADLRRRFGL